jgi:hypothetical protein
MHNTGTEAAPVIVAKASLILIWLLEVWRCQMGPCSYS